MDDYLVKPIDLGQLRQTLGKVAAVRLNTGAPTETTAGLFDEVHRTIHQLSEQLGRESAIELIESFLATTPDLLRECRLCAGDVKQLEELRRTAHSIKGSCQVFGLTAMRNLSFRLESLATDDSTESPHLQPIELVQQLEAEFSSIAPSLQSIREELSLMTSASSAS